MIVCTTLGPDGVVGGGLGRASHVALASVDDGQVTSWDEIEVGWDRLHGEGTEGSHHARIVKFLREHDVNVVVAKGVGEGMQRVLGNMGIRMALGLQGDARQAVKQAAGGSGE
ncbi:MAG TPA: NifB/NifX family molybdenum-iron cluster-binding protein [Nocardioidaceae bacterium]|nr:NifB/NifX family molybdenum-iron cluster-binding protein [Nocardioidaceae bacterium]